MARKKDRDGIFTRKGSFYISFTDAQGRRKQRKLPGVISLTEAKRLRNAELAAVDKARTLGYTEPTKSGFDDFVEHYLAYQRARITPKAYKRTEGIVRNHLQPFFGAMALAAIRRADVQRYLTERLAVASVESARKEYFVLTHLLQLAVDEEQLPANHADGIKLPQVPAGRIRYLQPGELHAVLEACGEWLRPIIALLVFTGMRRSELLGLRWMDIDRNGGRILLPQTKNGDGRIVWLNALASGVIATLKPTASTDRVFPDIDPDRVTFAFRRACRKTGIADFRLHDLRHTTASWARMAGADLQDVAKLLGHRDLRMSMRYAHLSEAHEAGVVKRLDGVFQPMALTAGAGQ